MKVYIYKPDKTTFQDDWLFAADVGFKQLGAKIIYFDDIQSVPYAKDNVVVGFVEDTQWYFDCHLGYIPEPMNIPDGLGKPSYTGRRFHRSIPLGTLYDNIEHSGGEVFDKQKVFIKPAQYTKQFSAGVVTAFKLKELIPFDNSTISGAAELSGNKPITSSTRVFISEPIEMLTEWRCFIHDDKLVGMQWYSGDFTVFPDIDRVKRFINSMTQNTGRPVAYTLDVCVEDDTMDTLIVECNDAWSIGNYGLDPVIYAKMLRDRWFEITGYRR